MLIHIYLILLIFVLSYREVQILIDRGSWKAEDHKKIFWYISWKSKWKNFDSFHVSNGIATLIMIYLFTTSMSLTYEILANEALNLTIHVGIYWLIWMQLRNLIMKIL